MRTEFEQNQGHLFSIGGMQTGGETTIPPPVREARPTTTTRRRSTSTVATTDQKEVNMKTQLRIAALSALTVLCLALAAVPASAVDKVLYQNYPIDGTTDAYTLNNGYEATDSFIVCYWGSCPSATVDEFKFGVWLYPGDTVTSVTWSIDSMPFGVNFGSWGNTNFGRGAGCAECGTLSVKYISTNEYGYQIAEVTLSGLSVSLSPGTYWLTLKDATTFGAAINDPVFWDVKNCKGFGCPSAYDVGPPATTPMPPNSFQIIGH